MANSNIILGIRGVDAVSPMIQALQLQQQQAAGNRAERHLGLQEQQTAMAGQQMEQEQQQSIQKAAITNIAQDTYAMKNLFEGGDYEAAGQLLGEMKSLANSAKLPLTGFDRLETLMGQDPTKAKTYFDRAVWPKFQEMAPKIFEGVNNAQGQPAAQRNVQTNELTALPEGLRPEAPEKINYNQPFLPDGTANTAYQDYQMKQRAAGATNVSVGQATEGERTAGSLAGRLDFAQSQIDQVLAANPEDQSPRAIPTMLNNIGADYLARVSNPAERQIIEAAQDDMLDAALTLSTGAAYTKEQFEGYKRSLFPQMGDTSETLAAKQARLANFIDGAYKKAGRAAPESRLSSTITTEQAKVPQMEGGNDLTGDELSELETLRAKYGRK